MNAVNDPVDFGARQARNGYDAPNRDSRLCGSTDRVIAHLNRPFGVVERDARSISTVRDGARQFDELTVLFVLHGTSL